MIRRFWHGKWLGVIVTSALILTACSNGGGNQDHSQHGGKQKTEGHSMHHGSGSEHSAHGGAKKAKVDVQWQTSIQKANQEGEIRITIKDAKGKPIPDFKVNHEKKLHLIIVSKDLSYFDHLHPKWKGKGEFLVKTKLPQGGKYRLYADFIPKDGSQTTAMHDISIQGKPDKQPIKVDTKLTKAVAGKEISLKFSPQAKAKQETQLTFTLKDAKTNKPITDLQPYLGAVGHVVIISENTEQYLHVHPLDENAKGPEAKFATTFPHKGIYKIWGQFKHQGKVITVPFVVNVS